MPTTPSTTSSVTTPHVISVTNDQTPPPAPLTSASTTDQSSSGNLELSIFNPNSSSQSTQTSGVTTIGHNSPPINTNSASILLSGSTGVSANVKVFDNNKVTANVTSDPK